MPWCCPTTCMGLMGREGSLQLCLAMGNSGGPIFRAYSLVGYLV